MKIAKFSGKLTKAFLFSLQEGVYLVSNVMLAPGQPLFAETTQPEQKRSEQWQRIKTARADGRTCHVFNDPADFMDFYLQIPVPYTRN